MKKFKNIIIISAIFAFVFCFASFSFAFADSITSDKEALENKVNEILSINSGTIDVTSLVNEYEELSKQYTNDEIADMVEENKDKLTQKGVNETAISAGTSVLRNMDSEQVTKILKEDIDINQIQQKVEEGYTTTEIVKDINTSLSTKEKIKIGVKLVLANKLVRIALVLSAILIIYFIILRWIIYKKAGKHGFAAIIPIYRDIVYFKICGMSPWVILFVLLPVIGWLILIILKIISKFELSYNFGKKAGFGLGLWLLPVIFEAILAFNPNIKYTENQ